MPLKPAIHGRDNRDGAGDPISGPWIICYDEGSSTPGDLIEDEDFVFLQNGWAQPAAPLEEYAFRRGLSKLDFKGHLDSSAATSATVALTIPAPYCLANDQFFPTVIYDGATAVAALVYVEAASGDVTITFPFT